VKDALVQRQIAVDEISWRNTQVDWNQYGLVVIRSPWDYQHDCCRFLTALKAIESSKATLLNSLKLVQWNVQKTYLRELQSNGVHTVPTQWLNNPEVAEISSLFQMLGSDDIVLKPVVGAGAEDAFRLNVHDSPSRLETVAQRFQNRIALAQPFVDSVVQYGEISLIFFDGDYCHSVLKTPRSGDFRVQEEHGGHIVPLCPPADVIEFAKRTLAAVPEATLYARVDLVFLDDGQPAVMEVELIEPSLYLSYADHAATQFAEAIERRL
jgi:glutathione synthase/RimK-type ligase-like ATP-grasp enzyme